MAKSTLDLDKCKNNSKDLTRGMEEEEATATILVLPEGCLSQTLSLTSPRDACRAAAISKEFKSVADSDTVWDHFLPPDYHQLLARAVSPVDFASKKQLYHHLSESHVLLDRGFLSLKLDKWSGKKCYMLGARELSIAWQDDTRYWKWGPIPESRFSEVGILRFVCWLDIRGKIASVMLSPKSTYAAYLVFQADTYFGGFSEAAKTKVSFRGIETETSDVYLEKPEHGPLQENGVYPSERKDGWMEVKLGELYCDEGEDGEVEMAFQEIWTLGAKHGLIVEGIELRPIDFDQEMHN